MRGQAVGAWSSSLSDGGSDDSSLGVVVANGADSRVEQICHVDDAGLTQSQAVGIVQVELGRRPALGGGALDSGAGDGRDRPVSIDLADALTVVVPDQH